MLRQLPALAGLAALAGIGAEVAGYRRSLAWSGMTSRRCTRGRRRAGLGWSLRRCSRICLSRSAAAEGDFRNWAKIREWATGTASTLLS